MPIEQSDFTLINLDSLRTGVVLHAPIYDAKSNPPLLLLSNGTLLTESLVSLLHKRGIKAVRVNKSEVARLLNLNPESNVSSTAKELPQKHIPREVAQNKHAVHQTPKPPAEPQLKLKQNSFFHQTKDSLGKPVLPERVKFARERREQNARKIDAIYKEYANGNTTSIRVMEDLTSEALLQIAEDMDIFLAAGLNPRDRSYPSRHSLQTSMVAMSIGTLHGLSRDELIELGIGCLIHDTGMMFLEDKSFVTTQEFGLTEYLNITKHPLLTQELFKNSNEIPKPSMMVSYQMHERCDGSGYPRGRVGTQIHYLAKIAMVADVYVALTSERPHRNAYHPYHAMEQILHQTNQGKFDQQAVRSLLHTTSLFPIGSFVQLSNMSPARVIRSNRLDFMKPVVETWDWKNLGESPKQLNLMENLDLTIRRPLDEFPLKSPVLG